MSAQCEHTGAMRLALTNGSATNRFPEFSRSIDQQAHLIVLMKDFHFLWNSGTARATYSANAYETR